jgi:hypothetical protein
VGEAGSIPAVIASTHDRQIRTSLGLSPSGTSAAAGMRHSEHAITRGMPARSRTD